MSAYAYPVAAAISTSFGVAWTLSSIAPTWVPWIVRLLLALGFGICFGAWVFKTKRYPA